MTTYTHKDFFTNVLPTLGNTFTADVEADLDGCNKNATYTFVKTQGGNIQAVVPDFDGQPIDDSNPDYWKNSYTGTFKMNTKGLGMSHILVDYLTSQLKTESNRGRFNSFFKDILRAMPESDGSIGFVQRFERGVCSVRFQDIDEIYQEKIIRTCLSRVNGEAVLEVFEGKKQYFRYNTGYIEITSDALYEAFDYPLQNGKPLDEAIQALHEKMLELVPTYKEFCDEVELEREREYQYQAQMEYEYEMQARAEYEEALAKAEYEAMSEAIAYAQYMANQEER